MNDSKIITGIDIGTTKIAVIIAEKKEGALNILGFGKSSSNGLNKGIVIDIEKTIQSIDKAIKDAEKQAGIEVESAYVGLTGEHIKGINCSGAISISSNEYKNPAGEQIQQKDIDKVLEHGSRNSRFTERRKKHLV